VQDAAQQQAVWATLFAMVVLHREYAAKPKGWASWYALNLLVVCCCFRLMVVVLLLCLLLLVSRTIIFYLGSISCSYSNMFCSNYVLVSLFACVFKFQRKASPYCVSVQHLGESIGPRQGLGRLEKTLR
jgi:hypothetical protein